MFELVDPYLRFHASFLAGADEFIAAGEERHAGLFSFPPDEAFSGVSFTRELLESADGFAEYVAHLVDQRLEATPRPATYVPSTMLWMADGDRFLGRISIRHRLTEPLLTWGGHVGYGVRPSERRKGYATRALGMVLPRCRDLGIASALVTCDVDNVGSRRTIEKNGGVYEDTREGKLRFWISA